MPRFCFALPLILVAVAAPADVAGQPAPLAGATRPKLSVLKTLPESQLFPLMNVMASALGVRCDYCHVQATPNLARTPSNVGGWVWDSDDKPPKNKAREMMQMVVELNSKRFAGTARVTCYTCHRGSTQPARTVPLPPPAAGNMRTPPPMALPSPDRVWTSYVNAVGQLATSPPGTGTIFSGWDERPEGRYGKVEIVVTADRYRVTVSTPEATTIQGLDGEGAWVFANDRVQRLPLPADAARMRRIAMRYHALKDRPANMEIVGVEHIAGRDAYVAVARIDSGTRLTLYFDVVTGLLRREMTTTETLLLPLQEQIDYGDYREVNGVQLPFLVQTSTGAPYDLVTRTFLQIRHNIPIDDALLRPPNR
jgi:hypothetical protein